MVETFTCTRCDYCMPCPYGVDIPGILSVWNVAVAEGRLPVDSLAVDFKRNRHIFLVDYERSIPKKQRTEFCTGCEACVSNCPQMIDIPNAIQCVDDLVEKLRRCGDA